MSDLDLQALRRAVAVAPDDLRAQRQLDRALARVGRGWHEEELPPGLDIDDERRCVYLRRAGRSRPVEMVYVGGVSNITPFYLSQFHCTRADYAVFCNATGHAYPPVADFEDAARAAGEQLDLHPVVNISIEDAREYCTWLGCSIPTIKQWGIAAFGGDEHGVSCGRCGQTGQITELRGSDFGAWAENELRTIVCPDCAGNRARRPR